MQKLQLTSDLMSILFWEQELQRSDLAFTKDFWPFFALMLVHCLFYVPTISITNSIAFAGFCASPQKSIPVVQNNVTADEDAMYALYEAIVEDRTWNINKPKSITKQEEPFYSSTCAFITARCIALPT